MSFVGAQLKRSQDKEDELQKLELQKQDREFKKQEHEAEVAKATIVHKHEIEKAQQNHDLILKFVSTSSAASSSEALALVLDLAAPLLGLPSSSSS